MKTPLPASRADIEAGLRALGVRSGMAIETHCSLSSFGHVAGGAEAVIDALVRTVGSEGAIVMPAFRLSPRLPLTEEDRELGLTCKVRILGLDEDGSDMGIVAETFRRMPGIVTGQGLFRVSAWGMDAEIHAATGEWFIEAWEPTVKPWRCGVIRSACTALGEAGSLVPP